MFIFLASLTIPVKFFFDTRVHLKCCNIPLNNGLLLSPEKIEVLLKDVELQDSYIQWDSVLKEDFECRQLLGILMDESKWKEQ